MIVEEIKPAEKAAHATELTVEGMTCGNCARHVTEAIQGVPGVASARVVLEQKKATVRWAAGAEPNETAILKAISEAGYKAEAVAPACHHEHPEDRTSSWH